MTPTNALNSPEVIE
jgi:hypothetical protein